jgi:hypothetical protein
MKLIDKSALVAEIWKRRIKHREFGGSPHSEYGHEDDEILSLIDTIEVKEVDLKKEVELWMQGKPSVNFEWGNVADAMRDCAKHFFELGIKTQKGE